MYTGHIKMECDIIWSRALFIIFKFSKSLCFFLIQKSPNGGIGSLSIRLRVVLVLFSMAPHSDWGDSRSRLGIETEVPETLGLHVTFQCELPFEVSYMLIVSVISLCSFAMKVQSPSGQLIPSKWDVIKVHWCFLPQNYSLYKLTWLESYLFLNDFDLS